MKHIRYGLKFKILSGVVLILAICTSFNLIYSYKLFVDDKTSYIYESGLKRAENISDQLKYRIDELKLRSEYNQLLLSTNALNMDRLINGQPDTVMTGRIENNAGKFNINQISSNIKNTNRLTNEYNISVKDFIDEISYSLASKSGMSSSFYWIFSPRENAKFFIYIMKTSSPQIFFFTVADLSPLYELFTKDQSYSNKIIALDDNKAIAENKSWLNKLNYEHSKKGTQKLFINKKSKLMSYSFVNNNIVVASFIDVDDAFKITKFLILKTGLFAGFLLSIAVALGIYFASSITFPLKKLTEKAKSVADGDFSSQVEIETSDEISLLGDTFNFMTNEIRGLLKTKEEMILKLEDYSKNLEKMVEQRTIELKEANDFMALMVNSLDQGLLVFDQELLCHPMFTKACGPIFGISPHGKTLPAVLNMDEEKDIQSLKQWANVVFNELIPFESAIDLGPRKKITGTNYLDSDYKFVQIDYYPMRDAEEKIANVVLIATDKTSEVQATEKAREKELYVSMILKILNNKTQFESFIGEVEDIFNQFGAAYSVTKKSINFELAMMLFHTLNGGFGIYSISRLQALAREYETEISNIMGNCPAPLEYIPILEDHVKKLRLEFSNFKLELDSLIGTKFATNKSFSEIPREKILALKSLIYGTKDTELLNYYNENFLKVPVINYFKAYDDLCKTTALKINKDFKGLIFHNEKLKIEAEPLLEFFNVLVHLFRNCLDHGLEDAHTRQIAEKSAEGHIKVSFDMMNSEGKNIFYVNIQDDGAGIDPKKIKSRYQQLRPEINIDHLSEKEIIYKIFDPFFSTRDEVSALSGRGVGMSAIKEVVDRLGGQIEIESHVGRGTSFSFLIPV